MITTETLDVLLVRLREFFNCVRAAGFKCISANNYFDKAVARSYGRAITTKVAVPHKDIERKFYEISTPQASEEIENSIASDKFYRRFFQDCAAKVTQKQELNSGKMSRQVFFGSIYLIF